MVLFNYALKELTAKIVYYGPGLSGKTTNLQYIYEELPIKNKGRMLTLATETDRTLYFDFLPVDAGIVRGIKTRVQLYTVPGQVFYNATRRMVLKGADGVVFVADSQKNMLEANLESFENLRENLRAHDLNVEEMPIVLQFNKRDLEEIATIEKLNDSLNVLNAPFYEAVAKDGVGVEETLQAISGLVLKSVIDRYGGERSMGKLGRGSGASDPARTDPARTDPDALVTASVIRGATEERFAAEAKDRPSGGGAPTSPSGGGTPTSPSGGGTPTSPSGGGAPTSPSGGGAPTSNVQAKVTPWPESSEERNVASSDDGSMDAFEGFNIEGILDEALKLDENEDQPFAPKERKGPPDAPPAPESVEEDLAEEESMFSGLLDEALGAQETESILDDALGSPALDAQARGGAESESSTGNDSLQEIEVDLLGEDLGPENASSEDVFEVDAGEAHAREGAAADLSELIKTRVSIPADAITAPSGRKDTAGPARVEVPVTLHVDPDHLDEEIELLLKIRLKRK